MEKHFEIRIFANPSGFVNLDLHCTYKLYTQDIVDGIALDAFRGSFKEDTYFVYFASQVIVLDYQFAVVGDACFRAPEAHISIAVERGWKLEQASSVFVEIRKEFNQFVANEKQQAAQSIWNKLKDFERIISDKVVKDVKQLRINADKVNNIKRGIVQYNEPNKLDDLLENPNRPAFRNYSFVYFLPHSTVQATFDALDKKYFAAIRDYEIEYTLAFPDGEKKKFKTFDYRVNYTCKKKYYKDLVFDGKLGENRENWEVDIDKEGLVYTIKKKWEPKEKKYAVICIDKNNSKTREGICPVFTFGVFSNQEKTLTVYGDDIAKYPELKADEPILDKNRYSLSIDPKSSDKDNIVILVEKINEYDIRGFLEYVYGKIGSDKNITAGDINKKNIRIERNKIYTPLPSKEIILFIPESDKYEKIEGISLDKILNESNYEVLLKKKGKVDLVFRIKDEKLANKMAEKPIKYEFEYRKSTDRNEEGGNNKNHYPHKKEKFGQKGTLTLREMPTGDFSYRIKIKGYKEIAKNLTLYESPKLKEEELDFEKTFARKAVDGINRHKKKLLFFVLGLLIGGLVGPYIVKEKKDESIGMANVERDSLQNLISERDSEIAQLNDKIVELERKVTSLQESLKDNKPVSPEVNKAVEAVQQKIEKKHPEIIDKIIHLRKEERKEILKKGSTIYNMTYKELSSTEQKEIDKLIKMPGYLTISIPNSIKTVNDAIKHLKTAQGDS